MHFNLMPAVAEKVNRPFPDKLAESREIVAHHFDEFDSNLAVAFSGGKDSLLVLHFAREIRPEIPVVFNNTGVEYPETVTYVKDLAKSWSLNITITTPELSFWECIDRYGFPTIQDKKRCCYWLKEKPMLQEIKRNGWLGVFTGMTAVESWHRMVWANKKGTCYHFVKWNACKVNPIAWWTEDEVREFIRAEKLPLNPLYGQGERRVGCLPCTAYKFWEQRIQNRNPKLYQYIKLRKDGGFQLPL